MDPCISVNVLCGNHDSRQWEFMVFTKIRHFIFLLIEVVQLENSTTQTVKAANGNHLACQNVCKNFVWESQNTTFASDMLLVPLGSCDMVLGVQWLSNLGTTIKWDFKKLIMEFDVQGKKLVLKGIPPKRVTTNCRYF